MNLPQQYKWLELEKGPKMLIEILKIYGVAEGPAGKNNPVILGWAKEVGLSKIYTHDYIPWCGLTLALVAQRAGKIVPKDPLWALNWAKFGTEVKEPMLGDVLTFKRTGGGHVGIYIGEDKNCYHIIGGNQGDKISIIRILKSRLYKVRRPIYSIGQPANVRKVFLSATGIISENEA